jgi:acyl-CoA thioester hydrolase
MHTIEKKIYYHDTDSGGVVYYANYLKFFEEGRTEYLAARHISIKELLSQGVGFVVARVEVDYKSPAYYGDTLTVYTNVDKASAVKIEFIQEIKREGERVICTARTVLVCVDKGLKPQALPEDVRAQVQT